MSTTTNAQTEIGAEEMLLRASARAEARRTAEVRAVQDRLAPLTTTATAALNRMKELQREQGPWVESQRVALSNLLRDAALAPERTGVGVKWLERALAAAVTAQARLSNGDFMVKSIARVEQLTPEDLKRDFALGREFLLREICTTPPGWPATWRTRSSGCGRVSLISPRAAISPVCRRGRGASRRCVSPRAQVTQRRRRWETRDERRAAESRR